LLPKAVSQADLQHHIRKTIPEEYQKCMIGMKCNLKQTLEIKATVADPRIKLEARQVANVCYKYIMALVTSGAMVTHAINLLPKSKSK
jgi:hypothetical protein